MDTVSTVTGKSPMNTSQNEDLLSRFEYGLTSNNLLSRGDEVVVAVSGGPDSVALLDLLYRICEKWQLTLHVAHLNHQLRGTASDEDERFVQELADRLGLPFHSEAVDIKSLSKRKKRSIEEAARMARRDFLKHILSRSDSDRIALGHTRSDQAETFLIRLIRGAGRTGLGAILPRNQCWIRPLLGFSRLEIETYVSHRNLEFRSDESNSDLQYLRNRIRHQLIPYFASNYNPQIEASLARSSEILQQEDLFLQKQAEKALESVIRYQGKRKIILDIKRVFGYHVSLQRRMLRNLLFSFHAGPEATNFKTIERLLETFQRASGSLQLSSDVFAYRKDTWCILSRETPDFRVQIPLEGSTEISQLNATLGTRFRAADEIRNHLGSLGPVRACFDKASLVGRLTLRNHRPGDRIQPFGMSGTRKVSDILVDCKIPRPLRDEIPLLLDGEAIIWIVGWRTSQRVAVTPESREVLEVEFQGGWSGLAGNPA